VWIKKKQFTIPHNGVYRVKFNMRIHSSEFDAYGRIYKNGVAYGTQRQEGGANPTTFSEDLAFNAGNTCEIWVMETDPSANGMYLYWASLNYNASIVDYRTSNTYLQDATGQEFA
jgi:hypothetical protein